MVCIIKKENSLPNTASFPVLISNLQKGIFLFLKDLVKAAALLFR